MSKNIPYVKQYNDNGELLNPITKENPYLHSDNTSSFLKKRLRNKYRVIEHPVTKEFIKFANKLKGNNRKQTKHRKSRMNKDSFIKPQTEE